MGVRCGSGHDAGDGCGHDAGGGCGRGHDASWESDILTEEEVWIEEKEREGRSRTPVMNCETSLFAVCDKGVIQLLAVERAGPYGVDTQKPVNNIHAKFEAGLVHSLRYNNT